ncbi:MAG: rhodanese-like domain-containing protein [Thermodesulfobacteriota bacterium]
MKKIKVSLLMVYVLLITLSVSSFAADIPEGIDSRKSYKMVLKSPSDTFIIDVRSRAEYEFVGHPDLPNGVPNIPYRFYPSWEINRDFVRKVKERYREDDTIITLCRSGQRAKSAARLLLEAGFRKVYYMTDSFEGPKDEKGHRTVGGWKVNGLPYTYDLKDSLVYK